MDSIKDFMTVQQPTAARPLLGLTVLLVEDSRFASEAVRLLCVKSGARIRRADSLHNARRHLSVYRPSVMIVDVGLPDGSGIPLIENIVHGSPRIDVVLGISGDPDKRRDVLAAGAHGFIEKPIASIAAFQSAIIQHLAPERQPPGPRVVSDEQVQPDLIAFQDDLSHAADVLSTKVDEKSVAYLGQFLLGVARSVNDDELAKATNNLLAQKGGDATQDAAFRVLKNMVADRLCASDPLGL